MPRKKRETTTPARRSFTDEFKEEAIQMLLDGHSASSVAERLGLSGTNVVYRWRREQLKRSGPVASAAFGSEVSRLARRCVPFPAPHPRVRDRERGLVIASAPAISRSNDGQLAKAALARWKLASMNSKGSCDA